MPDRDPISAYRSHRGLPSLAGVASLRDAARPGLSIERAVARLKRFHHAFKRFHGIFVDRLTSEPIYELKMAFSRHAYLCAEHVSALRARVGEMREPPLGLDEVPNAALDALFDEILSAPTTGELLVGLYEVAIPALDAALARYMAETNPLADAPSVRVCRFARLELGDMRAFGSEAVACLGDEAGRASIRGWVGALSDLLGAAGGLDGSIAATGGEVRRVHSATPRRYDPVPRRDERFVDLDNQGVNAEAFLYDDRFDARSKSLMMLFKRLREVDVPEMMASILAETPGKPWAYTLAMTRQLWDEARHAMMGEVGFVALGVDWTRARITHNWSMRLNTECSPIERHGVLYFIEQGLMPKTGKRFEHEVARESGIPLMATIQDFDWADEVLHAKIGRDWYVPQFPSPREALAFGDRAWSKILSNWAEVRDSGRTDHENWWPGLYRAACEGWGVTPDPIAAAFSTSYEGARADLKELTASA